jgi:LCP family protein required for cell wall assembly
MVIVTVLVCLLVAALVVPIARVVSHIDRMQVAGLGGHPAGSGEAAGSLDVLIAGTAPAGRSEPARWLPGSGRPVSLMVMHVDADRRGVTIVGIPNDLRVKVPGGGRRTLGDVARTAKPAQLVTTVESLTGLTMDHFAVLDWRAFKTLIDRLGGIRASTTGSGAGPVSIGGIRLQVTGQDAMKAVLPRPDVDSVSLVHRQLGLMQAVVDGTMHRNLQNPLLVYNFLDAVTQNLTVDKEWSTASMARLFVSVLSMQSRDMIWVTVPVTCGQGRLCRPKLDSHAAPAFWTAVGEDRIDKWLIRNHNRGRVTTAS